MVNLPVEKNKEYIAEVVGLGHEGEGVAKVNGFTIFIRGALPGEKVLTKILNVKKQFGFGKLLKIIEQSKDRIEAPCPIYDKCGGCQLQHLSYEAQLVSKRQQVVDNLERIGKLTISNDTIEGVIVHPTIGMTDPWRYRNKAQVPIGEIEGGLVGGFYTQGTHRIIDMDECLIQHPENDNAVKTVKKIAKELGIRPFNEETNRGLLRHVVVKYGFSSNEIMIVLITNGESIPKQDAFVNLIRQDIPNVVSICQSINTEKTNVIFGKMMKILWGKETILDSINGIQFLISPLSFYQVNPVQTELLYQKTLDYAQLSGQETVIDAYCGIGTISLFLAQHADTVYGVEIIKEAIVDARINAQLNDVNNTIFEVGKAEEVIPAWNRQGIKADVIVVDPPRKGCDEALLQTIIGMKPKRVVYVSCNPSTLARDLRILEDGGFKTVEIQPVDMFPHTTHVECVVRIYRED